LSGTVSPAGIPPLTKEGNEVDAILAIGDNALRLRANGLFPVKLDLSEIWLDKTGLPFVFAIWAGREEFYRHSPEIVSEIHHELSRCVEEGKKDLRSICQVVAPRIPMEVNDCFDYLCGMEYDLGEQKIKGLEVFFKYLIKRGEVTEKALPVKFV